MDAYALIAAKENNLDTTALQINRQNIQGNVLIEQIRGNADVEKQIIQTKGDIEKAGIEADTNALQIQHTSELERFRVKSETAIGVANTIGSVVSALSQSHTERKIQIHRSNNERRVQMAQINADVTKAGIQSRVDTFDIQAKSELEKLQLKANAFYKIVDSTTHIFDIKAESLRLQQQHIHEFYMAQNAAILEQERRLSERLALSDDFDEIARLQPLLQDLHDERAKLTHIYNETNNKIHKQIELLHLEAENTAQWENSISLNKLPTRSGL